MNNNHPRRTFVFEVVSIHNCYRYEQKIASAIGNDLVKIDPRDGHVTVSTHISPEIVRLTLEKKTKRKVVLLYELIPHDTRSSLSTNYLTHHGNGQNTVRSLIYGKSYHRHDLTLTKGDMSSYKCSGCKELGIGDRYICNHCSYILHPDCMWYKRIATHKFLDGSTFIFHQTRFDSKNRYCNACGSAIEGFFYHCEKTRKYLHPCCLNLTETVHVGETKFRLDRKLTSECFYCSSRKKDHKNSCWCYTLESQELQVHVSCMKDALLNCLKGERNNNMSTMVVVKHGKDTREGLKWAQRLLKVAICVLSGNPFPLVEVALELFE
ncbi:hypothetical protein L2E82_22454 [Cichorium intybus]|uniref:Uncharacterized protein n=1 Tax=Cichorium intybus TaxID=13427 RepID=A0ACB9DY38_CICIN|nr:hypothetical protein L2E82_22454 [Cichorium intybus]